MALQVWLPLLGNVNNQGLSNVSITNNNASVDNNGKIGKCLSFNGTSSVLHCDDIGLDTSKDYTLACWFYLNAIPTGSNARLVQISVSTDTSFANMSTGIVVDYLNNGSQGKFALLDGGSVAYYNYNFVVNTWYHVTYTKQGDTKKLYLNGELLTTLTFGSSSRSPKHFYVGGTGAANRMLNGKMNDVRVYDHALSPKEIEILSRGLVAHYPLCGNGRSGDNLLPYTAVNTANQALLATNYSSTWSAMTIETIDGYACYKYPKDKSSTWFATGRWGGYLKANTTYTYSAWIYFTASSSTSFNFTSLGHFQVYNSNSTASDKAHEDVAEARIYEPSTIPKNTWTKIRITFTTNSLANSVFQVYPRYNIGANVGDLYFRDMKLEETDHVTPWMPNSADTEYTAMGYNSTTEYDVSGYGYNGTRTGTITYTSESPRYSVCSYIPKAGYIQHPNALGADNANQEWTCCAWVKLTGTDSNQCLNNFNLNNILRGSSTPLLYLNSGSHDYYIYGSVALPISTWTHIAFVFKNSTGLRNIYINGELKNGYGPNKDSTPAGIPSTVTIFGGNFDGYVSDYREYATALSATQVAELYNTAVSVANNGTLMGYELVEG